MFDQLDQHPLAVMLERGLSLTVNADDPAYFGGYVGENYSAVRAGLPLRGDDLVTLARHSFEASFVDENVKLTYLDELDAYVG